MLATLALLIAASTPQDNSATALYNKVLPSVMTLKVTTKKGGTATGTAFLAFKDGVAVTAWHVVADARDAVAKFADGSEYEVSGLIDKDAKRDVALIRVKVAGKPLLTLNNTNPVVGTRAYAVGAPQGLEFSLSEGIVSQVRTEKGIDSVQFTCPVSPGNSGGPLMDSEGRVLGVVSSQLVDGQNLNFASPAVYAAGLDLTLPTKAWESVTPPKSKESEPKPRLSKDVLGELYWQSSNEDNPLLLLLYYVDGGEAVPENVYVGLYYMSGEKSYVAAGLSVAETLKFKSYLKQALEKGSLDGIPREGEAQSFELKGARFVSAGYVFENTPVKVTLKTAGDLKGKRWDLWFKFGKANTRILKDEAKSLYEDLSKWMSILQEEYGIGSEPEKP